LLKTISDSDPATEDLLSSYYQEQQQKKGSFWKAVSWGVKQYNHIANDDVAVMKVENLTTNETTYYLCRGE
jgi:ribosomal protein L18E